MKKNINENILGEEEVVKNNYEYLLLAKENGFFQDGYDKKDIATCTDWVVTWWIDELGDKKTDKEKFINEILPTFKRWFSNGVNSTGVGLYYDTLKKAEMHGIKINEAAFECISAKTKPDSVLNKKYDNYESISEHFEIKEIIENIKRFNNYGLPVCYPLADCYDLLLKLEEEGEKIDFNTFTFFHTAGYKPDNYKLNLYNSKKNIEEEYEYSTCNADEVKKLMAWLNFGGYNQAYVKELEEKIKKYQKVIEKNNTFSKNTDRILNMINKKITVSYYELDEKGNKKLNKVSGTLLSCNENQITISCKNPENQEMQDITIKDNDKCLISKVYSDKVIWYECRTLNERINIQKLKTKVDSIKSKDILSEYIEKFGSIEGIAYLKYASQFVEFVNKEQFPIDNLFAFCFENIAWILYGNYTIDDILGHALYTYNGIMSDKFETSLNKTNFGYPLNKFLSEDSQKIIERICHYVIHFNLKEELPEMPSAPKTYTSNEQHSSQKLLLTSDKDKKKKGTK